MNINYRIRKNNDIMAIINEHTSPSLEDSIRSNRSNAEIVPSSGGGYSGESMNRVSASSPVGIPVHTTASSDILPHTAKIIPIDKDVLSTDAHVRKHAKKYKNHTVNSKYKVS